jgi:O-antigen ligase
MTLTLIACLGIFLTQTIGDLGALLIGIYSLIIYLIFYLKNKNYPLRFTGRTGLLAAILIAGIIFGGVFLITKENTIWRFVPGLSRIATVDFEATIQNRFIAWEAGWKAFKEKPVFGYGWENFNVAFNKYYNPVLLSSNFSETYWDKPHNILLEYLYTTGVIGLLSYLGLLGASFYEAWQLRKKFPQIIFLVAGLAAYLIQNLVAFDTLGVYLMLFMYLAFIDRKYMELNSKL